MATTTHPHSDPALARHGRELAHRLMHDGEVAIDYDPHSHEVWLTVTDRTGVQQTVVPGDKALEAFAHPYPWLAF